MNKPSAQELLGRYSQIRRRHRYPALAAVPLVLLVAAYVGVLAEQRNEQEGLQAAIAQAAQQRAEKQAYVAQAGAYGTRLHELEDKLRAAHVVLPNGAEMPQFLAQLGTIAHDVGLSIERFEPKPEVPRDFYAEIGLHLQVRGSFHQIVMFAAQVGAMERIVNMTNLSMVMGKVEGTAPMVDGSLDVKIFRLLTDEQVVQAAAAAKDKKTEAK